MSDLEDPEERFWAEACKRGPDCSDDRELYEYLDGKLTDLDPERAESVARHVAGCGHCTEALARLYKDIELRERTEGPAVKKILRAVVPRAGHVLVPVLAVALFAAGIAGGCGFVAACNWYRYREVKKFWGFFLSEPVPAIVIGNAKVRVLEGKWRTDYIGVGDTRAVGAVYALLAELGEPRSRVELLTSAQTDPHFERLGERGLVLVGGPTVNRQTLAALGKIHGIDPNDKRALTRGFRFVVQETIPENAFVRHTTDGRLGIEDLRTGELCEHNSKAGTDCALVVRATLGKQEVLILAGFETKGTHAAARALTRSTRVLRELVRAFSESEHAAMVLTVDPDGEVEIHKFDTARNPQGR